MPRGTPTVIAQRQEEETAKRTFEKECTGKKTKERYSS